MNDSKTKQQHVTFPENEQQQQDIKTATSTPDDKYDDMFPLHSNNSNHYNSTFTTRVQSKLKNIPFVIKRSLNSHQQARNHYVIGLLIRITTTATVIGVLIAIGIGLRYTDGMPRSEDFSRLKFDWQLRPGDYLIPLNRTFKYNVLLDGHTHSIYSDGKMNARQLLNWHIANGYNAIIVTDHNTVKGGLIAEQIALKEYNQSIVVIPGMEYTCCRIHMSFIDINETIRATTPSPSDEELQRVIQKVHSLGGLVIVNHIPWSNTTQVGYQTARLPNHPTIEQLISWGVDGFEVVNQDTFDLSTFQKVVEKDLIQMTGNDLHHPSMPANVWLTINAANHTKQAIMEEIRHGRTSFLFDPSGTRPRYYTEPPSAYNRLAPLMRLGDYFGMFYSSNKGMYSFQGTFCHPEVLQINTDIVGWFVFWILLFIGFFELIRWCIIFAFKKWLDYRQKMQCPDLPLNA